MGGEVPYSVLVDPQDSEIFRDSPLWRVVIAASRKFPGRGWSLDRYTPIPLPCIATFYDGSLAGHGISGMQSVLNLSAV